MIEVVYLDMDGVLTNFDKRYVELFGLKWGECPAVNWAVNWEHFIKNNHFEDLEWHPEGKQLLSGVESLVAQYNEDRTIADAIVIEILSSSGGPKFHVEVTDQKTRWLLNNRIHYRRNIVPGSMVKKNHASDRVVLIDDTEKVIDSFVKADGHAILHKSAEETLAKLDYILSTK